MLAISNYRGYENAAVGSVATVLAGEQLYGDLQELLAHTIL